MKNAGILWQFLYEFNRYTLVRLCLQLRNAENVFSKMSLEQNIFLIWECDANHIQQKLDNMNKFEWRGRKR